MSIIKERHTMYWRFSDMCVRIKTILLKIGILRGKMPRERPCYHKPKCTNLKAECIETKQPNYIKNMPRETMRRKPRKKVPSCCAANNIVGRNIRIKRFIVKLIFWQTYYRTVWYSLFIFFKFRVSNFKLQFSFDIKTRKTLKWNLK